MRHYINKIQPSILQRLISRHDEEFISDLIKNQTKSVNLIGMCRDVDNYEDNDDYSIDDCEYTFKLISTDDAQWNHDEHWFVSLEPKAFNIIFTPEQTLFPDELFHL